MALILKSPLLAKRPSLLQPPPGAVLWLPGQDDAYSSTIRDRSGNGNHGTITGATWKRLPSGVWYLDFDGVANVVNCGSGASLDNLAAMTLMAWGKPDTLGGGSNGTLFDKTVQAAVPWQGWSFYLGLNNKLAFLVDYVTTDLFQVSSNSTITLSAWQHFALTWDGSATAANVHILVNGVELTYQTTTNGAGARVDDSGQSLRVSNNVSGARGWDGGLILSDILNTVLTTAQIASIYNRERHLFNV